MDHTVISSSMKGVGELRSHKGEEGDAVVFVNVISGVNSGRKEATFVGHCNVVMFISNDKRTTAVRYTSLCHGSRI